MTSLVLTSLVRIALAAAVSSVLATAASAQTPTLPRWSAASQELRDFDITRDSTIAHGGRTSIRVRATEEPAAFVSISAAPAAQLLAGRHVRFSVFLRGDSIRGTGAQLWARADGRSRPNLAFENSRLTPFRGTHDWTQLSISLDVPPEAAQVYFGVLLLDAGTLWMDDARIEADGASPLDFGFETTAEFIPPPPGQRRVATREAPRAVTDRGLANLTAYTNALGYIRFFYPTAAATGVNWDEFAVHGVRAVEKAPTPDSLASALAAIFAPLGPDLRFAISDGALPSTISKPANATHVVYWRHLGVGAPSGSAPPNPQSIYRSERVVSELSQVGHPVAVALPYHDVVSLPNVPDPARPLHVALGGGVSMSIPTALFTADSVIPEALRTPHPSRSPELLIARDRATRIADVALAWSLFEHFYPYFNVVHTDWPAARTAALRSAAVDTDGVSFQRTLERLVAQLHDGHGGVGGPGSAYAMPDVRLGWAEGRVFVTGVGDSAKAKGVRVGDELVAVEGRPVNAVLDTESARISGATPQWIRTRAIAGLLTGDPAAPALVRLTGIDGRPREVALSRTAVPVNEISLTKIAEPSPGVMYVDLGRISDADFNAALPKLEAAKSIIFDMRGYPQQVNTAMIFSHLTDSVIHSAHFETPVITAPDFKDVGYVDGAWTIPPAAPRLKARVVFLSGGGAISYAESTLGIVEAYRLGDIVGEPSAGTNGNVNPFALAGGYTVAWTGMLVQKRDGTPHHGVGVIPTIRVSPTVAGMRAGRDEVLERAIAVVSARPLTP